MHRLATLPFLALVAGASLTGCGDDDAEPGLEPGAEGITAVLQTYAGALADGDGPRACSLMSAPAQQALIQRAGVPGNCLAAVTAISSGLSPEAAGALRHVAISDITGAEERAGSARATASGSGADGAMAALGGASFGLSIDSARWGIDSVAP